MNEVKSWTTVDGLRVVVYYEEGDFGDPRDWDNTGTMACWHGRYSLGDEQPTEAPLDYQADLPEGTIILPLYLYDHSGLSMSTSPFSCPWDSGQVGIIYATPEKIQELGADWQTDEKVREILTNEVKTYDTYLTGQVYWYATYKVTTCDQGHKHEEMVDSCGGYYGDEGMATIKGEWPEVTVP